MGKADIAMFGVNDPVMAMRVDRAMLMAVIHRMPIHFHRPTAMR